MKSAIYITLLAVALAFANSAAAVDGKTKTVCKDVKRKDGQVMRDKAGKAVQECKTIKIHKKHEGTEVPAKK